MEYYGFYDKRRLSECGIDVDASKGRPRKLPDVHLPDINSSPEATFSASGDDDVGYNTRLQYKRKGTSCSQIAMIRQQLALFKNFTLQFTGALFLRFYSLLQSYSRESSISHYRIICNNRNGLPWKDHVPMPQYLFYKSLVDVPPYIFIINYICVLHQ